MSTTEPLGGRLLARPNEISYVRRDRPSPSRAGPQATLIHLRTKRERSSVDCQPDDRADLSKTLPVAVRAGRGTLAR